MYEHEASKGSVIRYNVETGAVDLHHLQGAGAYTFSDTPSVEHEDILALAPADEDAPVFRHHMRKLTSPLGEERSIGRDAGGKVTRVTYEDGGEQLIAYDERGLATSVVLPQGTTLALVHDESRREISRTSSIGESREVTYGPQNRIESVEDQTGTTSYHYDNVGRASGLTYPHSGSVLYEWDELDRPVAVIVRPEVGAEALRTDYEYDANSNLVAVIDPTGGRTEFDYDVADRLVERRLPNGVVSVFGYDALDRVAHIEHRGPLGDILQAFTYQRYASGEPERVTYEDGSYTTYTYDDALRIDTESRFSAGGTLIDAIDYDYDADGNRIRRTSLAAGVEDYQYQPGFRLTSVTSGGATTAAFAYDAGGRVVGIDRDGVQRVLEYNSDDKVTRVLDDGVEVARYAYDGLGRRTAATINGQTRRLFNAPAMGDGFESPHLVTDSSGDIEEGYVLAGERPLLKYDAAGEPEYYLEDALGSVVGKVDASGALQGRAAYDAFGELLSNSGAVPTTGHGGPALHGMWRDAESGLYYVRSRYYDARTGRFMSRDPANGATEEAESFHPYVFAHSNPLTNVDPSGRSAVGGVLRLGATLTIRAIQATLRIVVSLGRVAMRALRGTIRRGSDLGTRAIRKFRLTRRGKQGKNCLHCFVAGTAIALATGATPIEEVALGERVEGNTDYDAEPAPLDASSYRVVELEYPNPDAGEPARVRLLRPVAWVEHSGVQPGESVRMYGDEAGTFTDALVLAVRPAPVITDGPGDLVVGTFTRLARNVYEVRFVGAEERLRVTGEHPVFSADRSDWVAASDLRPGESVLTRDDVVQVGSVQRLEGLHRVFNIEVRSSHEYFASRLAIRSHNCHNNGGPGPQRVGAQGEARVRQVHDIGRREYFDVLGRNGQVIRRRITDGSNSFRITEIKNTRYQGWTRQLKDLAKHARDTGRGFDLFVRPTTRLSKPLLEAWGRGLVRIREIP